MASKSSHSTRHGNVEGFYRLGGGSETEILRFSRHSCNPGLAAESRSPPAMCVPPRCTSCPPLLIEAHIQDPFFNSSIVADEVMVTFALADAQRSGRIPRNGIGESCRRRFGITGHARPPPARFRSDRAQKNWVSVSPLRRVYDQSFCPVLACGNRQMSSRVAPRCAAASATTPCGSFDLPPVELLLLSSNRYRTPSCAPTARFLRLACPASPSQSRCIDRPLSLPALL